MEPLKLMFSFVQKRDTLMGSMRYNEVDGEPTDKGNIVLHIIGGQALEVGQTTEG
jgi:hypothetical protein